MEEVEVKLLEVKEKQQRLLALIIRIPGVVYLDKEATAAVVVADVLDVTVEEGVDGTVEGEAET